MIMPMVVPTLATLDAVTRFYLIWMSGGTAHFSGGAARFSGGAARFLS